MCIRDREYAWPLYPSIILSATILDTRIYALSMTNLPYVMAAITLGYLFLLRGIPKKRGGENGSDVKMLADAVWPILLVIVGYIVFDISLILITGVSILLVAATHATTFKTVKVSLKNSKPAPLALLIYGIMAFKNMLEASGAVDALPALLSDYNIPKVLILFTIPFIVSLLTGLTVASVGATFPVLKALIGSGQSIELSGFMLAYLGAYVGVLCSPVHLCLVLTREYYNAGWGKVYGKLAVLVGGITILLALLYAAGYPWNYFLTR